MQKHRDEIRTLLYKTFIYRVRPEKEDDAGGIWVECLAK